MYLTENQLKTILQAPYFTQPVTDSAVNYALYRGVYNASVYTVRLNLTTVFDENFILQQLMNRLLSRYTFNTKLLCMCGYDLVLVDSNSNPKSYYLWRANSNKVHFDAMHESSFSLTYDNVYRFILNNMYNVHLPSLNINFRHSNVVIDRAIAVVFSFLPL
jgi:hypothetical protein